ncbi:MAG TPA: hypothetical protein VLT59_06960 [Steroidobacteraceae bacterium]|nr:hypothetical protein [Steroidobacteraceae bacterium]
MLQVVAPAEPLDPRQQLDLEAAAFAAPERLPRAIAWLWEPASALLVVTRPEMRLPHYAAAVEQLGKSGWPVYERSTGGTAVPLARVMLVLTRIDEVPRSGEGVSLTAGFERLVAPLIAALAGLGITAGVGEVPGAFCDGRYNLVSAGRKLAGTAQRQRRPAPDRWRAMAHAVLLVDAGSRARCDAVYQFEEWAGGTRRLDPAVVTTVADEAGESRRIQLPDVRAAILRALDA